MKIKQFLLLLLFILVTTGPLDAYAAPCPPSPNGFIPLACTDGSKLEATYKSEGLSAYINQLFVMAISVAAMAAVLRLVYAGYIYMGSSGMWGSKAKAKEIMNEVALGLLLLLAVYLILNQINPDILKLTITLPPTP